MAEPQTTLEKLQALTPKVDSAERLAYFRQFDKKYYADAEFLNLIRQAAIELLTTGGSGIVQDNIDIKKTVTTIRPGVVAAVAGINRLPLYTVTDTQSVWYVVNVNNDFIGVSTYKYKLLNKGKGVYGAGGLQITQNDIELLYINEPVAEDVEADPATEIIPFVLFLDWNVWEWLNEQVDPIVIQPQNDGYTLFQGRVNGQDESYLFIGAAGTYGIGGLVATQADFQLLNKEMTPAVQSITGYGIDNTDSSNPYIKEIKDLPYDFYIGGNPVGSTLTYKTDIYRVYQLPVIPGFIINMTNEIVRNQNRPNDIVLTGNFSQTDPMIAIVLVDCRIIDNVFVPTFVYGRAYPDINAVHGLQFHNNFCYGSSKYNDVVNAQKFIKFNPYNLSDYKVLALPTEVPFRGSVNDLQFHENFLYTVITENTIGAVYTLKIDENLNSYEVAFEITGLTSANRIPRNTPFLIYNDELYLTTINQATAALAYNTIGVRVYNINTGVLLRSNAGLVVGVGGTIPPIVHWMTVYKDKLMITSAAEVTRHQFIARIDINSLALNQYVSGYRMTDDNTVFANGDLYLNEESYVDDAPFHAARLIRVPYNDLTNVTVEIENYNGGYGCHSSLNPLIQSTSLKTNMSQFRDDLPFKTLNGESLKGTGNIVVSGNADTKLDLAGGTMTGVLNTVGILPVTHNAYSLGNSSLLFTSIWTNIVNANNYRPRATSNNINFQSFSGVNHTIVSDAGRWNFGTAAPDTNMKVGIEGNAKLSGTFTFGQFTTGTAPAYVRGASYFNTTLNKLMIGGVSAWETVQSS